MEVEEVGEGGGLTASGRRSDRLETIEWLALLLSNHAESLPVGSSACESAGLSLALLPAREMQGQRASARLRSLAETCVPTSRSIAALEQGLNAAAADAVVQAT